MNSIKHLFIICLFFISFSSIAQPTITSNVIPTIGDSYYSYFMNPTTMYFGDSGANVIWDFSSLVFTTDSSVATVISPVGTPYDTAIAMSDFVVQTDSGYGYYSTGGNTRITSVGQWFGSGPDSSLFNLGIDLVQLPVSYSNSFNDTTFAVIDPGTGPIIIGVDVEFKADAYGTLITPFDTILNCLRIKSVLYAHIGAFLIRSNVRYYWYNNSYHFPVFSIDSAGNGGQTRSSDISVRLNRSNTFGASVKTVTVTSILFSETTTGNLQVQIPATVTASEFSITDALGRIVSTKSINGATSFTVSTANLSSGIYFLQVKTTNGTVCKTEKWMKK